MSILGLLVIGFTTAYGGLANQPAMNGKLKVTTLAPDEIRYTGKPYNKELGAYIFNYRNYDPQINRWTTSDPSGFPDGANNCTYAPCPVTQFDSKGLSTSFSQNFHEVIYAVDSQDPISIYFTVVYDDNGISIPDNTVRLEAKKLSGTANAGQYTWSFKSPSATLSRQQLTSWVYTGNGQKSHQWDFAVDLQADLTNGQGLAGSIVIPDLNVTVNFGEGGSDLIDQKFTDLQTNPFE